MDRLATLKELFAHHDWATDRVLRPTHGLPDQALDRPFEMGPGSLRSALLHVYGAERIWFERWRGQRPDDPPYARELSSLADLEQAVRRLAGLRDVEMDRLDDAALDRRIDYTHGPNERHSSRLGDILLHVCNHAMHHRAQAVNMLRRLGVKTPAVDYIFLLLERRKIPADAAALAPPAAYSPELIRDYFAYGDWAQERVLQAAEPLPDAALDRPFEMGLGTLRQTLAHIHDAEEWWLDNWATDCARLFPEAESRAGVAEMRDRFRETARRRHERVRGLSAADALRPVRVEGVAGAPRTFALGGSMLQLCNHGTHHRAQAVNMLRHLGVSAPRVDYILMTRGG